jgi:hypothetical protein
MMAKIIVPDGWTLDTQYGNWLVYNIAPNDDDVNFRNGGIAIINKQRADGELMKGKPVPALVSGQESSGWIVTVKLKMTSVPVVRVVESKTIYSNELYDL